MPTKQELQEQIENLKKSINSKFTTAEEKEKFQKRVDALTKQLADMGGAAPAAGGNEAEIANTKNSIKDLEASLKTGGLNENIEKMLKNKITAFKEKLDKLEGKAEPPKKPEPKPKPAGKKRGRKTAAEKKEAAKPAAKPKRSLPVKKTKVAKPVSKRISKKAEPKKPEKKGRKDYSGLSRAECLKRLEKAEKTATAKKKHYKERVKSGKPPLKLPHEVVSSASKSIAKKVKAIVKSKGEITKGEADKTKMKIADIVEIIVKAIPEKKDKLVFLKELCGAVLKRVNIKPKDFKMI